MDIDQEDKYRNDYWRQTDDYTSQVYIKQEPQDQAQEMPEGDSVNRVSELATSFLSRIEPEVFVKSEGTPETAGDTKVGSLSLDSSKQEKKIRDNIGKICFCFFLIIYIENAIVFILVFI